MASCMLFYMKWFLLFLHLILVNGEISDQRLCANPSCDEPVSHAKTLLKYIGNDKYSLTFLPNAEVIIYSKSAGSVPHLWGGSINGKRGYFPSKFVREYKVLTKDLPYTVPTEKGLIAEKQLELNDSNKELSSDATSILSDSGINKETLNIKEENSIVGDHVNSIKLPINGNVSDNEIAEELGNIPSPKSTDLDSEPNTAIPDQTSTVELVEPSKRVSETEVKDSKEISDIDQAIKTSPDIFQISPSKSDYLNLPPSAFSASPSLTNVVAHTKEVPKSGDNDLLNSAVWFPESKAPSRSFFGHGVSADSSVDETARNPNEKLTPELESWAGVTASTNNEKYIMVEGTQIPVHDDEEQVTTALPALATAALNIPSADSLIPTSELRLPSTREENSATANSETIASNAQLNAPAPSTSVVSPVDSTLVAEASLSPSDYLASDKQQVLDTSAVAEQTKVVDNSNIVGDDQEKSMQEKPDPRATEIGSGGEAPDVSGNHKDSEIGSDSKESQTTIVQEDSDDKNSGGWFDAVKSFVTLDEEVKLEVPPVDGDKKTPERETPTQFRAEESQEIPSSKQNNEGNQDIVKESAVLDDLHEDDDDDDGDDEGDDEDDLDIDPLEDLEDENIEDMAEEKKVERDRDELESRQKPDSVDADLKEKSYHDRIVGNDDKLGSSVDQSSEKPLLNDSNEFAKAYEARPVMDQPKENDKNEVSGNGNTKTFDREPEESAIVGDKSSIIKENLVNNIVKDGSVVNDIDLEASSIRSDEIQKPLEEKEASVPAYDKSDIKTDELLEKDISKTRADESVVEKGDSGAATFMPTTESDESVTKKDASPTKPGISETHDGDIFIPVQRKFLEEENISSNVVENVDATDINDTSERPSTPLEENLDFQAESDQHQSSLGSNLPDAETTLVSTEPTFGVDESLNTPLPEDIMTTESPEMNLAESAFSESVIKNINVEDNSGTCEGPGIDGVCSSMGKILVDQAESAEHQGFWESISTLVSVIRSYVQVIIDLLPDFIKVALLDLETSAVSPRVVIFVLIVGSFLFLLEISFIAIKTRCKETCLLGKISSLDQRLFTVTKERDILKMNMETYTDKNLEGEYHKAQATIQALQAKLKMSQNECGKLQGTVSSLEEQLETATDAGLELNQLLSEFLTSQNDSGKLQNAVLQLQEQLDDQQKRFGNMQLTSVATQHQKDELNEELQNARSNYDLMLQKYNEIYQELENVNLVKEDLQQLISGKDEEVNQLQESNKQLLQEAEVWDDSVKQLQINITDDQRNIQELEETVTFKNNEIEALKDCLLKLKIAQGKADGDIVDDSEESSPTSKKDDILERLMDVSSIKAELKSVVDERDSILAKLEIQQNARVIAEEQAKKCLEEAERVQSEYDKANLEREAAQTKLNVLSNYFKEKELQLQKELGVQEAQRQQSQESVISVTQRIAMYEQETSLYKSQIGSLKAEIESQERSYKNQLTSHEKKAHENWLAARAAERKLEESKQEAATLRNRLTLLEQEKANQSLKQTDAGKSSLQNYPDNNGEAPSPPRLGLGDRSDSMDLPTSSRSSIFSRDPLDILHGLPFLPPDRPLPPPFMRGLPPGGMMPPPLLPPMDDRLPLPPFDPRRGMFPMHPPPPGPMVGGMPPEHWMGPRRRGSPPFDHPSQRERPSPPLLSQRSPPPFERRPSSSRNAVSPLEPESRDMGAPYERDYRERTPPARFFEPPLRPGFGGLPPPTMRGPPNSRPPMRRDVYPPGRADGSIDPRTSSPMTPKQDGKGTAT